MKGILLSFVIILISSFSVFAQVPRTISYQGLLTDPSGTAVPDGNKNMSFAIYADATGGVPLFSETQSVSIIKGKYNVIIGSVTALPQTLSFGNPYFLGISVESGAELTPRTALTAVPYALRAGIADGLGQNAAGAVTKLNNLSGNLTLQGGGGTTINANGSTITISSSGGSGGSGIQGLQSGDGSINVLAGSGPIADVRLVINSVVTKIIADGAVTVQKMSSSGGTTGQVLMADGSGNASWQTLNLTTTLPLPFAGNIVTASPAFAITNGGAGVAVQGTHFDTSGVAAGVRGETNSKTDNATGVYGTVNSSAPGNLSAGVRGVNVGIGANGVGVHGLHTGGGIGVYGGSVNGIGVSGISTGGTSGNFSNVTASNAATTVVVSNVGSGDVLNCSTTGKGKVGIFNLSNVTATVNAMEVTTSATAIGASAIFGRRSVGSTLALTNSASIWGDNTDGAGVAGTSNTGYGVFGSSKTNHAVYGLGTVVNVAGVYGRNDIAGGFGVYGSCTGTGTSVYGASTAGISGKFENVTATNSSNTLTVSTNGTGIAVSVTQTGTAARAGYFTIGAAGNGSNALEATTNGSGASIASVATGTGRAGLFTVSAVGDAANSLESTTNGTGAAISATSTGTGRAGLYTVNAAANSSAALESTTNGTGNGAKFAITNAASASDALLAVTSGTGFALKTNSTGTGDMAVFQVGGVNKARIDKLGKGFFNGGTAVSGADVAESFAVVGERSGYEPGDVLVIASGHKRTVEKCSTPYATNVIGVHATKPGVLMGERDVEANMDDLVPMGVVGVVPTKVTTESGAIRAGDLLVTSSKAGYAMKADRAKLGFGMVLGKALEDFDGGAGLIEVFVNVK